MAAYLECDGLGGPLDEHGAHVVPLGASAATTLVAAALAAAAGGGGGMGHGVAYAPGRHCQALGVCVVGARRRTLGRVHEGSTEVGHGGRQRPAPARGGRGERAEGARAHGGSGGGAGGGQGGGRGHRGIARGLGGGKKTEASINVPEAKSPMRHG